MSLKDQRPRNKAKKRARKNSNADNPQLLSVGIGWYSEEEWNKLAEAVPDPTALDDSWQEWEKSALDAIWMLKEQGIFAMPVTIRVAELQAWCQAKGRPLDAEARAEYVAQVLRSKSKAP